MVLNITVFVQLTEVGPVGVPGLDVQSVVEVEPGPDPDLVPIRHLNMKETFVLNLLLKMPFAMTSPAGVGICDLTINLWKSFF